MKVGELKCGIGKILNWKDVELERCRIDKMLVSVMDVEGRDNSRKLEQIM